MIFDFTGTSGTELTAWNALLVKHTLYSGTATLNASGRAVVGSSSACYYHNETKASADYDVSCDLYFPDTSSTQVSVCGRIRTDINSMYHARYSGGSVSLYKLNAGTQTQIGSSVSVTVASGETHTIKLSMVGSTIKVFWDGVEKISQTDTMLSSAGVAGIRFNASQTTQVDNFNSDAGSVAVTALIGATTANAVGAYVAKSSPKGLVSATTANAVGSYVATTGAARAVISITTEGVVGSYSATGSVAGGTFTSEPLRDYAGNALANAPLNFVCIYNDTTGALVVRKTSLVTNSSGVFAFSDPALVAGTTYRADWETAAGARRMPRKAAT